MKIEEANKLSLQEALDFVMQKLVAQGHRCVNASGGCTYGDGAGNHCAVGWLLDEDNPVLMGFGYGVVDLIRDYPDEIPAMIWESEDIFNELQEFHDSDSHISRSISMGALQRMGIDVSQPHWQQWVDLAGKD